jgi:hypothetical protein
MLPQPNTRLWLSTRATHALLIKLLSISEPRCGSGKAPSRIVLCTVQCTCQCQTRRRDLGGLGLSKEGASCLASAAFSATQDAQAVLGSPQWPQWPAQRHAGGTRPWPCVLRARAGLLAIPRFDGGSDTAGTGGIVARFKYDDSLEVAQAAL